MHTYHIDDTLFVCTSLLHTVNIYCRAIAIDVRVLFLVVVDLVILYLLMYFFFEECELGPMDARRSLKYLRLSPCYNSTLYWI